jgi:fused signal recognition particle receptor
MPLKIFSRFKERLHTLFSRGRIDDQFFEELEEVLLMADTGPREAEDLLRELRDYARKHPDGNQAENLRLALCEIIRQRLAPAEGKLRYPEHPPALYLFVGVNGSGKTTTLAKLAHRLKKEGKSVLLAAGDTFRAGATEQVQVWAERLKVDVIKGAPKSDPAAVLFSAIESARARNIDCVLADTAGRQQTRLSLMAELEKILRVSAKALGRDPDEVLLVLDGHTGQNALRQAEEFAGIRKKHARASAEEPPTVSITGLVVTKLDGSAKAGFLLGIHERLGVPIKLLGTGETLDDLHDFRADEFARMLVGLA